MYLRDVPDTLKQSFRALCVQRGTTMRAAVIRFMEREVAKAAKGKS